MDSDMDGDMDGDMAWSFVPAPVAPPRYPQKFLRCKEPWSAGESRPETPACRGPTVVEL